MKKLIGFFLVFFAAFNAAEAQIVVTPATAAGTICTDQTTYTNLSAITIAESTLSSEFAAGITNQTLDLSLPAGFEFDVTQPGSVTTNTPSDISIVSSTVSYLTPQTIRITIQVGGAANLDELSISGLRVRSTGAAASGNILRTGGSLVVDGNATADQVNHGTLTSQVAPSVNISTSGPTTFCQGSSVTLTAVGGTNWVWSNGSTAQSITVNSSGSYTVEASNANGCSTLSNATSVVVNAAPNSSINLSGPRTFCQGESVSLTTNDGTSWIWSNGSTSNSINVTATGSYKVTITNANGCISESQVEDITVNSNPTPSIVPGGPTTFCQGESVNLTASIGSTGTNWIWTGGGNSQILNVTASGSYQVTVTDPNGCKGVSSPISVNVRSLPVANITPLGSTTFCEGNDVNLTSLGGNNWQWSNGSSNQTINVENSGSYTVTVTDGNNCSNVSSPVSITVNPLPNSTITTSGPTRFCEGNSVDLVASTGNSWLWSDGSSTSNLTVTNSGTYTVIITNSFNCSAASTPVSVFVDPLPNVFIGGLDADYCKDESSVNLNGLPSGGIFTGAGMTGSTFSPISAGVGNHNLIYTYTDANNCTNSTGQLVTVNDIPAVNFSGLGTSYAENDASVNLNGNPAGGTFSGNGISGSTFNPGDADVGSHIISYTVVDGNSCSSTFNQSVTVNPLPSVGFSGLDSSYCANHPNIVLSGSPVGGVFTGNGINSATSTFSPSSAPLGSVEITYTFTDETTGATNSTKKTVEIKPLPTVAISGLGTAYCIDESPIALSGFPVSDGTSTFGSFTGTGVTGTNFNPANAGIGNHNVTYTYTDANQCVSSDVINVVINGLPSVSYSGLEAEYCLNDVSAEITGTPAGGTFVGPGISGTKFDPQTAGAGNHVISYSYSDPSTGCTNTYDQSVKVNLVSTPQIINDLSSGFCVDGSPESLVGSPSGGVFSGVGIIGSNFDPNVAGVGTHNLSYIFTDAKNCSDTIKQAVNVFDLPSVILSGLGSDYCVDADTVLLTGFPATGTFSGAGSVMGTNKFVPSLAGSGTHDITYSYTDVNGCSNTKTASVEINSLPLVDFFLLSGDSTFCDSEGSSRLVGLPAGGSFSGVGVSTDQFFPEIAEIGTHGITYSFTDNNGCAADLEKIVVVYGTPSANFSISSGATCGSGDQIQFVDESTVNFDNLNNDLIASHDWWFGDPLSSMSTSSNPSFTYPAVGSYEVVLKAESRFGCVDFDTTTINVGVVPNPDFTWENTCVGDTITFSGSESNVGISSIVSWDWNFGETPTLTDTVGIIGKNTFAAKGLKKVTLAVQTRDGCADSVSHFVKILPVITTFPYKENFENGIDDWLIGAETGSANSWDLVQPTGVNINTAGEGEYSVVTSKNGNSYYFNEQSWVSSPCFDLTGLDRPMLSMKIFSNATPESNGGIFQYTLDGGTNWQNLGGIGTGVEWFETSSLNSMPGGDSNAGDIGWSTLESDWRTAKHDLDTLAGKKVRFRLLFASDPGQKIGDGFGFDNFCLGEKEKSVLIEHFTNSAADGASQAGDQALQRLDNDYQGNVIPIQYHVNFPAKDAINLLNPNDPLNRANYYGISTSPFVAMDGNQFLGNTTALDFSSTRNELRLRTLDQPQFNIDIVFPTQSSTEALQIEATIRAVEDYDKEFFVRTVIVESDVTFNGNVYNNVMRKLLPDNQVRLFTGIQAGENVQVNENWLVQYFDDPLNNIKVIVFVQDRETKEVLQAKIVQGPTKNIITGFDDVFANEIALFPNPFEDQITLTFEQALEQGTKYQVTDINGRVIQTGTWMAGSKHVELDLNEVSKGLYLLDFQYQGTIISRKILKQ